jgi:hypothetical protein
VQPGIELLVRFPWQRELKRMSCGSMLKRNQRWTIGTRLQRQNWRRINRQIARSNRCRHRIKEFKHLIANPQLTATYGNSGTRRASVESSGLNIDAHRTISKDRHHGGR